jgi:hypothetical protein
MCQLKSAIVLKNKVFMPMDYDSHTEMLKELGIQDDYLGASKKFVRVEIIPQDKDIFNHDLNNWKIHVDQDIMPEWFDSGDAEAACKEELKKWFIERFIVNDNSWKEYKNSRTWVKNSKIKTINSSVVARGNSSVVARDNSSVVAWDNSSVEAWDNSSVEAWGNSSVVARGNSSVVARDNSSVVAWDNSSVVARRDSSVVAWGNSSVVAWDNSSVVAWDNSSVVAWGNSSVVARGNSSVVAWDNSSVVIPYSTKVNVKGVNDKATIKDLSGKPKIIIANDFDIIKFSNKA